MNLEISGKRAIICGASSGLGKACAIALAREGVEVTIAARGEDALHSAAKEISEVGKSVVVHPVVADTNTEKGLSAILKICPQPDILITNVGRLVDGSVLKLERQQWTDAMSQSFLGPLFFIKSVMQGMSERRFGRVVNIMGSSVKAATPLLSLTNGSRASLIAVLSGLAREVARFNVTINNLLPGPTETEGLVANWTRRAESSGKKLEDIRNDVLRNIPAGRLGSPNEFADLCVFLCSSNIGYLTAQNLVIDGGAFAGLF